MIKLNMRQLIKKVIKCLNLKDIQIKENCSQIKLIITYKNSIKREYYFPKELDLDVLDLIVIGLYLGEGVNSKTSNSSRRRLYFTNTKVEYCLWFLEFIKKICPNVSIKIEVLKSINFQTDTIKNLTKYTSDIKIKESNRKKTLYRILVNDLFLRVLFEQLVDNIINGRPSGI